MRSRRLGCAIGTALAMAWVPSCALALSEATETALTETLEQVNSATSDLEDAEAALLDAQTTRAKVEEALKALSSELPEAQERAAAAMCALYRADSDGSSFIATLLSSQDLSAAVTSAKYSQEVTSALEEDLAELTELEAELEEAQQTLEELVAAEKTAADEAESALEEAKAARAAAQEAAEQEQEALAEAAAAASSSASTSTSVSAGEVDWTLSEEEFVAEWTARIDAYLSGSPLSGYGDAFAQAAWDFGVDPRWSPAISCIESTKGRHCFKSHNAWGWGSVSWSSWEEAIRAHVKGLASGYGTTLTLAAAKKYCPPTYKSWYSKVAAEMNKI